MKRMYCAVCRKKMKWNKSEKHWECLIIKLGQEKRVGCGYIHVNKTINLFLTFSKRDRENIYKALGGKTT